MFRRLIDWLAPEGGGVFLAILGTVVAIPLTNFHPLVWRYIVDEVILAASADLLLPAVLLMTVVHLTGSAVGAAAHLKMAAIKQRLGARLRCRLHSKLSSQGSAYHLEHPSGDLLARVTGDVAGVTNAADVATRGVANQVIVLAWTVAVLFWIDVRAAAVGLAPLLLLFPAMRFYNARVASILAEVRTRDGAATHGLQEDLRGLPVLRTLGQPARRAARYQELVDAQAAAALRGAQASTLYSVGVQGSGFLSNALLAAVGAWMVLRGWLTLGGLVAFRGYWWTLFSSCLQLATLNEQLQRGRVSVGRIAEILDAPEPIADPPGPRRQPRDPGRVHFRSVHFSYRPGARVLDGLDLEIAPGERVGITGPSGAGKTTLLGLLMRLHDPDSGVVEVGGVDARELRLADLRATVAAVLQEPFLFDESLRENLLLARPDARDGELLEALERAGAAEFVATLPRGLGTRVGELGATLSGGQRQRLCIARAFLRDAPVLLLDEATSSVEAEAQRSIRRALSELAVGRTTLIVSHQLQTLRDAGRIVVVRDGRVAEEGSHQALLAADGWYARMARLQGLADERRRPVAA